MFVDVTGMFFVSTSILILGLERSWDLTRSRSNLIGIGILSTSLLVEFFFTKIGLIFFGLQLVIAILLEWRVQNSTRRLRSKRVLIAIGLLCIAFLAWILDLTKIVCIPTNHIFTGHSAWHLLTAFAIWIFAQAYTSTRGAAAKADS